MAHKPQKRSSPSVASADGKKQPAGVSGELTGKMHDVMNNGTDALTTDDSFCRRFDLIEYAGTMWGALCRRSYFIAYFLRTTDFFACVC